MQEKCGNDLKKISFNKNVYESSAITLNAELKDGAKRTEIYDKDFNLEAVEISQIQNK